jgi:hypothetical protein
MSKPFSRDLYNKHNGPGIQAAVQFLSNYGYTLYDDTEAYKSHDLIFKKDDRLIKVEVEHSTSWKCPTSWQGWSFVTCPYRKKDSKADLYLMFNEPFTGVGVIQMKQVHDSFVIRKNTKYTKDEPFFSTPNQHYDFFFNNTPEKENRYL